MELIGYELCPYVQRCTIALHLKKVPCRITFIDLERPPPWLKDLSPLGQVPVLKVEGKALFDSTAINEYLDEAFPPRLHPGDPLERGRHRGWISFSSACLASLASLYLAGDERSFRRALGELRLRLSRLEDALEASPYFAGQALSLVDVAFAPFFVRLFWIHARHPLFPGDGFPRVQRWGRALVELPEVKASLVADFAERFLRHIQRKAPFAARLLTP